MHNRDIVPHLPPCKINLEDEGCPKTDNSPYHASTEIYYKTGCYSPKNDTGAGKSS